MAPTAWPIGPAFGLKHPNLKKSLLDGKWRKSERTPRIFENPSIISNLEPLSIPTYSQSKNFIVDGEVSFSNSQLQNKNERPHK